MPDIHCHIIHGVDDGSFDINESLEMAKLAVEGGTDIIVATPHSNSEVYPNYWDANLRDRFVELKNSIAAENIPVKLCLGHEILADGNFIELLKKGKLLTLNGSRYPLVEFDFLEHSVSVFPKLEKLIAEGFVPIVAHPERYAFVHEDFDTVYELKEMGCLLQINKGSIKGSFGRKIYDTAHEILGNELADFVASDAHSPYMRTTYLADVHESVSVMYSVDYAEQLFKINPLTILKDKKI